jgi:predicted phage tail protein
MANIQGRKSGSSKPSSPKESPDSLHSVATAKILLALSEGECAGGLTDKDIYLDGTPVRAQDGTLNFPGVTWEYRPGTQAQEYIQGIPSVENEISINTPLKQTQPWTRAISNTQLSALRVRLGLPALQLQKDNGDVVGSRVEYKIELATDGGAYQAVVNGAFDGKTTSLYERSHRIDLPKATTGWQVRVTRITADSVSNRLADATNIEAYAEVIDAKLRYPNTELLFVTFDAKQFSNIPQISVKAPGRLIRVPTTYDPVQRIYSGTWDGSFKWAYSNNPAWVYYDIVLNPRFGLGDRLDASQVDKWELYRIAQYCDQLVPDGLGGSGTEPRFLCDVFIQSQNEAFNVLRDLASIFRGMTYWANNQLFALADQPRDMTYIFTRANVIGGKFVYAGGSERNRYSTAMVSWSNPDNHYSDEVEAVVEQDLVRRYGVRQTEITAIGCVRRTEANRRGRWVLLTNAKDRLVTFSTGLEGMIPLPGHIIGVADQNLSGKVMGGRISAVNGRVITLDRVADVKAGNRLILNLPSGISQARTVQAVNDRQVTVTTAYSETPEVQAAWSVDADDLFIQQYRVTGVTDNDDATFTIAAINHNPDKYAAIDSGARLDERPISAIPPGVQAPPAAVTISSYSRVVQNICVETMRVTWDIVPNAIAYECEWRKDNGDWVNAPRTSSLGFEVPGIYSGRYTARVRAISSSDISSVWTVSPEKELTGKVGLPPKPLNFRTTPINWGIQIDWNFPDGAEDSLMTEIQYSAASDGASPLLLSDVPYPAKSYTQLGLRAGQVFWYRARLIDRIGNQSEWTDWVRGMANDNADDYLGDIAKDFLTAEDGERLSSQIDTNIEGLLQNALNNNSSVDHQFKMNGEIRADVLTVKTTVADLDKAFAEQTTLVSAQFQSVDKQLITNTAALEQKMTSVFSSSGGSAIYSMKAGVNLNGNYYDAGMTIAVLAPSGQPVTTRIGFNANQLVVMSGSGGTAYSPFAIYNGQVFISDAFIRDGTITNAKIGDFIQSGNWDGKNGWHINKNGTATFRNIDIYGAVQGQGSMSITSSTITIRDGNGDIKVKLGYLG